MKNIERLVLACLVLSSLVVWLGRVPLYAENKQSEVTSLIKILQLGKPFNYQNLTIVPIYSTGASVNTDCLTLDEAVNKGYILITEVEGGHVPQVKVVNKSDRYIFLMAGEILTGARQNRLVGKDVLLGPGEKEVIVPVYCVEQGRWDAGNYDFNKAAYLAAPLFREGAAKRVTQSEMWEGVHYYSEALGYTSPTQSLTAGYSNDRVRAKTEEYIGALKDIPRLDEDAVGVAVAIGNKIVTIDIFSSTKLFSGLWDKLLRSYAMGAIAEDSRRVDTKVTQKKVKEILRQLYETRFERKEGIALGEELSTTTTDAISSALVYKGSITHLSAFPNQDGREPVIDKERTPVILE
jgi:hypothetical protein